MNYLRERVSYLKGLAEGMKLDESSDQGKLLKAIIDVMDDIALAVDDIEEVQEQVSEQIDYMDEDLAEIEDIVFTGDDYIPEDDQDEGIEMDCPHCEETLELSPEELEGEYILCPSCEKKIEVIWECDCDCDCSQNEEEE